MQVKKKQLEPDTEQRTGAKLERSMSRLYIVDLYLSYMQSTSCEMLGWMKHRLESKLQGEVSIISDMQMTPPLQQKVKSN